MEPDEFGLTHCLRCTDAVVNLTEHLLRCDAPLPPLARVVQTCVAAPSQWDAWTDDGQYLYLRYRHSRGTVELHPGPDCEGWKLTDPVLVVFEDPRRDADDYVGNPMIELGEFLARTGLRLTPDATVVEWEWPEDDEDEAELIGPSDAALISMPSSVERILRVARDALRASR